MLEKDARKSPATKLAIELVGKHELDHGCPMAEIAKTKCVAEIREKIGVSYRVAYNAVYRATKRRK